MSTTSETSALADHVERPTYDLHWSDHGRVMLVEQSRRPAPLSPETTRRVASAVTVALIATAAAAVLVLLGYGWGGYLLVLPIVVFGLLLVWKQRRSYRAMRGVRTVGISDEVIRVHAFDDGAGVHDVGAQTEVEARDATVVAMTGADELVLLSDLDPTDAEAVATAIERFLESRRED